jgi:hypothetical protein
MFLALGYMIVFRLLLETFLYGYYAKGKFIPELTMAPISIYIGAPQVVKKQSEKSTHTHNVAMLVPAALAACYQPSEEQQDKLMTQF